MMLQILHQQRCSVQQGIACGCSSFWPCSKSALAIALAAGADSCPLLARMAKLLPYSTGMEMLNTQQAVSSVWKAELP